MKIYYEKDANMKLLKGKKVAVIGYGSQGFAHSNNLKESGIDVMVGLRKGSKSWDKAAGAGLKVVDPAEAAKRADIIMVLVPDELQGDMYKKYIEGNIKKRAYLAFAHGFNIHFGQIVPREDVTNGRPTGERIVGGQDRASGQPEDDVDAFRLERAQDRIGAVALHATASR